MSTSRLVGMTTNEQIGQQLTAGLEKWQGYHRDIDAEVIVPTLLARRQVGELVGAMIRDADARNADPSVTLISYDSLIKALHAHTDAMRDLREALITLGLLAL